MVLYSCSTKCFRLLVTVHMFLFEEIPERLHLRPGQGRPLLGSEWKVDPSSPCRADKCGFPTQILRCYQIAFFNAEECT